MSLPKQVAFYRSIIIDGMSNVHKVFYWERSGVIFTMPYLLRDRLRNASSTGMEYSILLSDVSSRDEGVYWCSVNVTEMLYNSLSVYLTVLGFSK